MAAALFQLLQLISLSLGILRNQTAWVLCDHPAYQAVTQSFHLTVSMCASDGTENGSGAPSEVKSSLPFRTDSGLSHRSRTLPHAGGETWALC